MANLLKIRCYKSVPANTTDTSLFVPTDGQDVYIRDCGGNAAVSNEVRVEIAFGTEIIFSTHGDDKQLIEEHYIGDGTKEFKISLINDSSATETIGVYYNGDIN